MKRALQLGILLIVLAGSVLLWTRLFPSPEKQIRRRMIELQELLSFRESDGNLAVLSDLRQLGTFFTEDAEVRVDVQGGPHNTLTGRDQIVQMAGAARRTTGDLDVEFLDVVVRLDVARESAVVEATGKVRQHGTDELWIEELRLRFVEIDGHWLISSVETVPTLTRVPARLSRSIRLPNAA